MLVITRPTSTTVLYTVSTSDPNPTWPIRISKYLILVLRVLATILVLVTLFQELSISYRLPALAPVFALPRTYRLAGITLLAYAISRRTSTTESLLVLRGLGVQTRTSSPSYLWKASTRFIPTSRIQDVLIHEAFRGFEVRFYLSIVVEGEGEGVVVFPVSD